MDETARKKVKVLSQTTEYATCVMGLRWIMMMEKVLRKE